MSLTNNIIPRQSNTHTWIRLAPWLWLGIFLCIAVVIWNQRVEPTTASNTESAWNPVSARDRSPVRDTAIDKRPIESMRVGQRVLAFNPKVTPEERLVWQEPDWENWLHLSLVIPKEDGSLLEMEILRSEDWVRSALQPIMSETSLLLVAEPDSSLNNVSSTEAHMAITPWRGVYRDMLTMAERSCALGLQLDGFAVEMDLHELAISGPAFIRDMKPCESVSPGSGHVITATFKHSSGDVIDLIWSDGTSENLESVGTTSNHPFYSFDRGDYVQAGSLQEGERLLTYSGDTKRVVSKPARPGPEAVYNLEVFGEHVYFIGNDGVLVHNSDSYNLNATAPSKGLPAGISYTGTIERAVNPKYVGTAWDITAGNLAANHRYSGLGRGALYTGTSKSAVLGELAHYGVDPKKVAWVSKTVSIDNVLDLTNASVRKQLGVTLKQLTDNDYLYTQAIGDFARGRYSSLLVPSARAKGTTNLVILPGTSF